MKRLALLLSCCAVGLATALAQSSTDAFYIYQNDGHFNGFFYDEVEKITYSKLDTLGVEFDDYVSQEIVTADSTYRIMLSAIDSVGFVQPEPKYSSNVRILHKENEDSYSYYDEMSHQLYYDSEFYAIQADRSEVPTEYLPHLNEVFYCVNGVDSWAVKVVRIEEINNKEESWVIGYCEPVDNITDLFIQQVGVEEYGYNPEGKMISRRVAGRPDLTVGNPSKKKAKEGQWQGDLFKWTLCIVC